MFDAKRDVMSVVTENAVVAGVDLPEHTIDTYPEPLSELKGLAQSAGATVLGGIYQKRDRPDHSTLMGKGKVEELGELANMHDANVVLFDNELEPAQLRNIEKSVDTKVIDRTELILDIFATRAQTSQARLQVELAQLEYLRPRLKRMWTHLERHGGGIGTRGPGEQQLETDRRLIDKKIRDLKSRLSVIQKRKEREVQARSEQFRVSLVGYTNAGKSTLMNQLTGADVLMADQLFATLDTRTRQWKVPGWGKILLSDTVGFIRHLPHDLVESFKATLEETVHADLLLHVVNAAHPNAADQIQAVNEVLEEIEVQDSPTILVLNQVDLVEDPVTLAKLEDLYPTTVRVSAYTGQGIEKLQELVTERLSVHFVEAEVVLPISDGKTQAFIVANAQVLNKSFQDDSAIYQLRMPRRLLMKIREQLTDIKPLHE